MPSSVSTAGLRTPDFRLIENVGRTQKAPPIDETTVYLSMTSRAGAEASQYKVVSGVLDLSGRSLTRLPNLPVLPALKILNVSDNDLQSFAGLVQQPNLEVVIARKNQISALNGLQNQPALHTLDIRGTPLAERANFRRIALATVGDNLFELNGQPLNAQDQVVARLIRKRQEKDLFLAKESELEAAVESEPNDPIDMLYAQEHREFFASVALNEAVLFDLQSCGPMPYIDENSSEQDLARAIKNVRNRVRVLREKIAEMDGGP
jgi:hypothetical protein